MLSTSEDQKRLDRLRDSANLCARNFRWIFVVYLAIAIYILVFIGSTGRGSWVQVPLTDVGVSVKWVYAVVPWVLMFFQVSLLAHGIILSSKVKTFESALSSSTDAADEKAEHLNSLYPSLLGRMVAGRDERSSAHLPFTAIVFFSVVILPLAILLYAQTRFSIHRNADIISMNRAAVILDILLLWWLWPRLSAPDCWIDWWGKTRRDAEGNRLNKIPLPQHFRNAVLVFFSLCLITVVILARK
jgi:hypothetical protein